MGRQMEGDQNRGGKRGRQIFRQKDQRLHTARGGANGRIVITLAVVK